MLRRTFCFHTVAVAAAPAPATSSMEIESWTIAPGLGRAADVLR